MGHSNVGVNDLFKRMFTDSENAENYSMSETKYSYIITFGLGPLFAKKLIYDVKRSLAHSVLFDEALSDELQKKQLDVYVRYWSYETSRVDCRYLTSLFIGHGRKEDLMNHYEEATKDLDPAKS